VQCVGRLHAEAPDPVVDIAKIGAAVAVKVCGVAVAWTAGKSWGTDPVLATGQRSKGPGPAITREDT
jgi:hypothetical protein